MLNPKFRKASLSSCKILSKNLVSNFKITQIKQSRKSHENPKISIFTSASSHRRAGTGAKNRNEARSYPKKRALLRKR